MNILAIIPARGGSKRLPNKNILDIANKPLIAWTIDEAKKSKYIDKLIVSTDSESIVVVSKKFKALVPFIRPDVLSQDTSDTISVLKHAIEFYKNKFDYILLLQPTSPLRTVDDIDAAIKMLKETKAKAIVSVCETEHSPLWTNTLPKDRSMKDFIKSQYKNVRSQDLPIYYRLNGVIYISEIEYFLKNNGFLGDQTKAYIMSKENSIDIDTELDFIIAETLLKRR